jgi:hypothetical protein
MEEPMAKAPSILDPDFHPDTPTCDQLDRLIDTIGLRNLAIAIAVVCHIRPASTKPPSHCLRSNGSSGQTASKNSPKRVEADLGPVRYLATLLGSTDERTMRYLILIVALLLDPAAVLLLLAATHRGQR